MKNLKKLIAVVLTFTLVFSAMAVGFAGTFSDVKDDAPYASAVARLQSLGLVSGMPDGTYQPDGAVTRAQMIAFVNAAKGLQAAAKLAVGPTKFSDVPANYWASGDINIANPSGYPDGTFKPNNTVTYPEALAMLLRALGITEDLSWPYGVIAKAADIGLTDGVSLSANDTLDRGEMAILVNNALDLPLYTYNSDGIAVEKTDANGNVIKLISKVGTSANYLVVATNDVDSNVPAGYVDVQPATASYGTYTFGGDQYISAGSVDFNQYLGKVVTVISDKSGNTLAVSPVTTDVKTFTVSTVPTVSGSTYSFSDVSVSVGDIPVVIDGVKTTLSKVASVIDKGSNVTFINNDGKSGYDYAVVTDATGGAVNEILVQKDVTSSDKYIDNRISLYDSNNNPLPVVGAVSKATDIKAGDVVYQVPVANKTVLYVVRQSVTGTISQVSVSGGTTTVTINGTDYTVGTQQIPGSTGVAVSAGSTGTAIIGKNNTIVQWSGATTATNYAVVQYGNTFTAYNTSVSLALPDGTSKVFNVVYSNVPSSVDLTVNTGEVVTYTLDSNGNISNLKEVVQNSVSKANVTTDKADNFIKINGTPYYVTSSTVFYNYNLTNKTLTPVNWSDIADNAGFDIYTFTKSDGFRSLGLVIFKNVSSLTSTTTPVVYVTSASKVATSSTSYISLNVIENGVSKTYNAPAGTLDLGDIAVDNNGNVAKGSANTAYQLTVNASGNVTAAKLLKDADGTGNYAEGTTVYFNYSSNSILTSAGQLPLDSNVVVINGVNNANTVVGLGSIVQDTVTKDSNGNITGLNNVTGSSVVDVYTNPTTGKVVLIVIKGTK